MAGTIIELASNGDYDWTQDRTVLYQFIGKGGMKLSLTNMDDETEPQIEAGSVVEIDGSYCRFETIESITGWAAIANSTDVYIKLSASGTSVSASFTTTAPTWSGSKQGYYVSSDRYIGGLYKDASANYAEKYIYNKQLKSTTEFLQDNYKIHTTDEVLFDVAWAASTDETYEFYILKPINGYYYYKTYLIGSISTLSIYQNSGWHVIAGETNSAGPTSDGTDYNIIMVPGKYRVRIYGVGQAGGTLSISGIYGTDFGNVTEYKEDI